MARKSKKANANRIGSAPAGAGFFRRQLFAAKETIGFVSSSKFWKAMALDALFLVCLALVIMGTNYLVNSLSEPLLPDLANVADLRLKEDPAYAEAFAAIEPSVVAVLWKTLGLFAAAYLIVVFLAGAIYSTAWELLKGEKAGLRRMLLLNIEWYSAWLVLIIITLSAFPEKVAQALFIVEFLLLVYMDFFMRARYTRDESATKNILGAFKMFFSKIHNFISYIIIVPIWAFVIYPILGVFAWSDWLFFALFVLLHLFVLGLARAYAVCLVRQATKERVL